MNWFNRLASAIYSLVFLVYLAGLFVFFVGLSMWFDNPNIEENIVATVVILTGVLVMMMADDA